MTRSQSAAFALAAAFIAEGVFPGIAAAQTASPVPSAAVMPASQPVMPQVPDLGQQRSVPQTPPNADLVGVQQQPFVGITLQNAIGMALQRNTALAIQQSDRRVAGYQIVAAKGAYDVNFQLVPSYSHSVSPVINPLNANGQGGPVTQDTFGVTAGVRGLTMTGAQYIAAVVGSRVTSSNASNTYNPYYQTALQFAITQPLAKNRAIDQPRLQLRLSQIGSSIAQANALLEASNTVAAVEGAYYDLVYAWQNVGIQESGLQQATAQAQSNSRLAARGVLAPSDIAEANTQVQVFQDNVYAAIQNVQHAQTELKTLILASLADPVWAANLVPTTPYAQVPAEPSIADTMTAAIRNRPEIAQLRGQRAQSNVNRAFAHDQLKPQVDVGLGYTTNGFAGNSNVGSTNPFSPLNQAASSHQTGNIGTAFKNGFKGRYPSYSGQLIILALPIGNDTAKADYAIAQEQQKQVALNETALVEQIRAEASNAIQGLRETQSRVVAARAARGAAERVLSAEQRRFDAGTSTTFLVLQRQQNLATQRGREVQAQTDLDKAIVELQRVNGDIFAQNGVDVNTIGLTSLQNAPATSVIPSPAPTPTVTPKLIHDEVGRLLPYVRAIAGRLYESVGVAATKAIEREDLEAEGYLALGRAMRTYNPDRGVPLRGHVGVQVLGHLRHVLRDHDPRGRANRGLIRAGKLWAERATHDLGCDPTYHEVEAAVPGFRAACANAEERQSVPLDAITFRNAASVEVEHLALRRLERENLWRLIKRLPPRSRAAITLRYGHDLELRAVARSLGLSVPGTKVMLWRAHRLLHELTRESVS